MIPTFQGILTCILGLWMLRRGNPLSILCAMLVLGLFEASAAVILISIGGSSIPPPRLMLLFLIIAVIREIHSRSSLFAEALMANAPILIFAIYGIISAFVLPYLFAGQIDVVPMRPVGLRHLTDAFPLKFSPQNITTAFYIAGTGLTAVCAYIAGRLAPDFRPLVKAGIGIAIAQAVTGVLGVVLAGTAWDLLVATIRNGAYSQLSQVTSSLVRISGFMAEPSNFARFGVVWFIFCMELWLRNISARWAGAAALLMGGVLMISTSSTAYVGLAAYGVVLAARLVTGPSYLSAQRVLQIFLWLLAGLVGALVLVLFYGPAADAFTAMLGDMTVNKASSSSGQQRLFWAMQGLDAFVVSGGLGIGAGSFRSSSLLLAIIGSMGVVGTVAFVISCASLFVRKGKGADPQRNEIAQALAWTAMLGIVPLMVMGNAPDPGMEFGALAGLSLAFRLPALQRGKAGSLPRWGGAPAVSPLVPVRQPQVPRSGGWRHSSM